MDDMFTQRKKEIDEIGTQIEEKDQSNAKLLERACKRADILSKQFESGAIDVQT